MTTGADKTVNAIDPTSSSAIATFAFVQHDSYYEGDYACVEGHQYDTEEWVTASIHNVTASTVSFDYTIPLAPPYSSITVTVTALGPGATAQTTLCFIGCGEMVGAITNMSVTNVTYPPPPPPVQNGDVGSWPVHGCPHELGSSEPVATTQ